MEAEKIEAAAFADQLWKELVATKEKVAGLVERLDTADSTVRALLAERDQERARADRAQAVADERSRMIDALREELTQVRKDKDRAIDGLQGEAVEGVMSGVSVVQRCCGQAGGQGQDIGPRPPPQVIPYGLAIF